MPKKAQQSPAKAAPQDPMSPGVDGKLPGLNENPQVSYNPRLDNSWMQSAAGPVVAAPKGYEPVQLGAWELPGASGKTPARSGARESTPPPPAEEEFHPTPSAFQLMRVVGQGGFGQVWEAIQVSLGRVIAVKRLRDDLVENRATNEEARRAMELAFRQEALTTALLDHPNIVPVHDIGSDELGRLMLAMKLVRGQPWLNQIDDDFWMMPVPEFLARHIPTLMSVAQAVAFAHSRGIVHRDLKPSQVMVGKFGEVLLMDWGLAIVYDEDRLRASGVHSTIMSQIANLRIATSPAGTPCYMAPEQTEQTAQNVGTWTDIYLLGGILYYLLTGTPPHNADKSTVAMTMAASDDVVAPEQRAPNREIPPELAALAMSCLQRKRTNRPTDVPTFIRSLQDYMSGMGKRREAQQLLLQIQERTPTGRRDYRWLSECLNLATRALALLPGHPEAVRLQQFFTCEFARTALDNRDLRLARVHAERLEPSRERTDLLNLIARAEKEQQQQDDILRQALEQARVERDRAEAARQQAEEIIDFMLYDLYKGLLTLNRLDLLEQVAQQVMNYFEANPERNPTTDALMKRSRTLSNIGIVLRAKGLIEESFRAYREAQNILHAVTERAPDNTAAWSELAGCHDKKSALMYEKGHLEEAIEENEEARLIRQRLVTATPGNAAHRLALASTFHQHGACCWRLGRQQDALAAYDEAHMLLASLYERMPDDEEVVAALAYAHNNRCWSLRALGRIDDALIEIDSAIRLRQQLVQAQPDHQQHNAQFAWSLKSKGLLLEDRQNIAAAIGVYRQALSINRMLCTADPDNANHMNETAFPLGAIGRCLGLLHDYSGSLAHYREALELQERLFVYDPSNRRFTRDYVFNLLGAGDALRHLGRLTPAEDMILKAVGLAEGLTMSVPDNPSFAEMFARSLVALGELRAEQDRMIDADELWKQAIEILTPIFKRGDHPAYQVDTLARAYLLMGRPREAEPYVAQLRAKGWRHPEFLRLANPAEAVDIELDLDMDVDTTPVR